MKKFKNIAVSVSLNEDLLEDLKSYKDYELLNHADNVYFVHIYNQRSEQNLPDDVKGKDFDSIREYVLGELHKVAEALVPGHKNKDSDRHSQCIFMSDEKISILDYLDEVEADLVIAETRGEQGVTGIFKDSYCFWLVEHAKCDVLVLKSQA